MTRYGQRRALVTHYSRAVDLAKEAKTHADAGKLEDSRNLYRLSMGHLAESSDERAFKFRKQLESEVALVEQRLGIAAPVETPALAKTTPEAELSDVELLGDMVASRLPLERELSEKKGTGT